MSKRKDTPIRPLKPDQDCDKCGKEKPVLYLIKHRQTTVHWRCQKCLNGLLLESNCSVLIIGLRTKTQSRYTNTTYNRAAKAAEAAHNLLIGENVPASLGISQAEYFNLIGYEEPVGEPLDHANKTG